MLGLLRERSQVLARSEASVSGMLSGEVRNKNQQQQKTGSKPDTRD